MLKGQYLPPLVWGDFGKRTWERPLVGCLRRRHFHRWKLFWKSSIFSVCLNTFISSSCNIVFSRNIYLEQSPQKSRPIWGLQCISLNQGTSMLTFDKFYLQMHLLLFSADFWQIVFGNASSVIQCWLLTNFICKNAPFARETRFSPPLLAVQGWDEVDNFVDFLWRWNWKCEYWLNHSLFDLWDLR